MYVPWSKKDKKGHGHPTIMNGIPSTGYRIVYISIAPTDRGMIILFRNENG